MKTKILIGLLLVQGCAPIFANQEEVVSVKNKRINQTLGASATISAAVMAAGFIQLLKVPRNTPPSSFDSFLFSVGFGGLTGAACGALEHNNVHPLLTWLGEYCVRKGCIKGIGMSPREEHFGFATWGVEYPAQAGSWISYLLYQYAKQSGKSIDETRNLLASLSALQPV